MAETPHNIEAEQALLGILLYDNAALPDAAHVSPDHLYEPVHARLLVALREIAGEGRLAECIGVTDRLKDDAGLGEMGGLEYLGLLVDRAPPTPNAPEYAHLIVEAAQRREILALSQDLSTKARRADVPVETIIQDMADGASAIAQRGAVAEHLLDGGAMIAEAIERAINRQGRIQYPVGLRDVDRHLGGLNAGELTILGGWTGMGKTIAGLQVAKSNASARLGTLYISLEMAADPMGLRLACDLAFERRFYRAEAGGLHIKIDAALRGDLTDAQWHQLRDAQEIVARWPMKFEVRPGLTVPQIEAIARRAHARWRKAGVTPGPVIVDHIGKVRPSTDRRGDKTAETADISNALAEMAKRLECPVVALTQLNRDVDKQGEDKRPSLSNIKQSGALAEDARQVIFVYRPEYYYRDPMEHEDMLKKAERIEKLNAVRNHLYWIVAKNSNGPPGQVLTFCEASASAVRDW